MKFKVTSLYDHKVKFVGLLFECQQWIAGHGSEWHMHRVDAV